MLIRYARLRRILPAGFAAAAMLLTFAVPRAANEARLVRYPHYHAGKVTFTYLADIWTADENGQNVRRITVNRARDVYPRFSPDGQWIAFSSDREGNLDVYIVPVAGGTPKRKTRIGVINEPPPIPVIPTSSPVRSPATASFQSMSLRGSGIR